MSDTHLRDLERRWLWCLESALRADQKRGHAMSDERVRAAERRWRETGTQEDESKLLQERVRSGELPRPRLQQAATLGYPSAMMAMGFAPGYDDTLVDRICDAMRGDREGMLRACIAIADPGLRHFDSHPCAARADGSHRVSIDYVESQLELACYHLFQKRGGTTLVQAIQALVVCRAHCTTAYPDPSRFRRGKNAERFRSAVHWVTTETGSEPCEIQQTLIKGLIPWLLYSRDPVKSMLSHIPANRRARNWDFNRDGAPP